MESPNNREEPSMEPCPDCASSISAPKRSVHQRECYPEHEARSHQDCGLNVSAAQIREPNRLQKIRCYIELLERRANELRERLAYLEVYYPERDPKRPPAGL